MEVFDEVPKTRLILPPGPPLRTWALCPAHPLLPLNGSLQSSAIDNTYRRLTQRHGLTAELQNPVNELLSIPIRLITARAAGKGEVVFPALCLI